MSELVSDLRDALRDHQIRPHFQTQLDLSTGLVVGVEALARWTHPRRGPVLPGEFVPTAEAAGLAGRLGAEMLDRSCREVAAWRAAGHDLELAVNVSTVQLEDPAFCDIVLSTVAAHGLPLDALTLELTEREPLSRARSVTDTLKKSKAAGIRFSVDDFGAGWWTVADVERLRPRELKLDRTVIQAGASSAIADLVGQVHAAGGRVVAEGIETTAHLETARALACERGQGYLFSRPVPASELTGLLA